MTENVLSFFKQNVGEEDVIKLLLMSAGKALLTVAILIAALLSFTKLIEWYDIKFVILSLVTFTIFLIWSCMYMFGWAITYRNSRFNIFKYKTWKYVFDNMLPLNKVVYFDDNLIQPGAGGSAFASYGIAWIMAIIMTLVSFAIGVALIGGYAIIVSILSALDIPNEFLYITIPCSLSVIIMSILFLKLKWKKIWMDGFNWNLAAWCICAAIVITVISFVAGVAIRRIAGFIGIEYTIILVSSYVMITATYMYIDLKQWIANKARMAAASIEKETKLVETSINP